MEKFVTPQGLYTSGNPNQIPAGAMSICNNLVITPTGLYKTRTGVNTFFTPADLTLILIPYQGYLINFENSAFVIDNLQGIYVHSYLDANAASTGITNVPSSFSGGNYFDFYETVDDSASLDVPRTPSFSFCWNNLYTSTDRVVRKLDNYNGTYRLAGVPVPSFYPTGPTTVLTGTGGFLSDGNVTAYRATLVRPDNNQKDLEGEPSGRLVVSNINGTSGWSSTVAANVTVRVVLPIYTSGISELEANTRIRLYRSQTQIANGTEPTDEMGLVYETILKASDITNGYIEIRDIVPDGLTGLTLYTSPSAQPLVGGNPIYTANERPPTAKFLASFKNCLLAGLTRDKNAQTFHIIAVGGSDGIQDGDKIIIGSNTYTGVTGSPSGSQFKIITSGSAQFNIRETSQNLVGLINRTQTNHRAVYLSGSGDAAGYIAVQDNLPRRIRSGGTFDLASNYEDIGGTSTWAISVLGKRTAYSPVLNAPDVVISAISRSGSTVTVTTSTAHSFIVGEQVTVSGVSNVGAFPSGVKTIVGSADNTHFTYTESGSAVSSSGGTVVETNKLSAVGKVYKNRVAFSKPAAPDAFPAYQYMDIGRQDAEIRALATTRDSIWVFKEDGLFRIFGNTPLDFTVQEFDLSIKIVGYRTFCVVDNVLYAWTTKGVLKITESGITDVGKPINDTLSSQISSVTSYSDVKSSSFMTAYESENRFDLALGTEAVSSGDWFLGGASTIYSYSTSMNTWASYSYPGVNSQYTIVNPQDDKMYSILWDAITGVPLVYKELKGTGADSRDFGTTDVSATVTFLPQHVDRPADLKVFREEHWHFDSNNPPTIAGITFRPPEAIYRTGIALDNRINTHYAPALTFNGTSGSQVVFYGITLMSELLSERVNR